MEQELKYAKTYTIKLSEMEKRIIMNSLAAESRLLDERDDPGRSNLVKELFKKVRDAASDD